MSKRGKFYLKPKMEKHGDITIITKGDDGSGTDQGLFDSE